MFLKVSSSVKGFQTRFALCFMYEFNPKYYKLFICVDEGRNRFNKNKLFNM